jgi:hypothetical protein
MALAMVATLAAVQPAAASSPTLSATASGTNVVFSGSGYTAGGPVTVQLFYYGYNSYGQYIGDQVNAWSGNATFGSCSGFPILRCFPGGYINFTIPMSQLEQDIVNDPYTQYPGEGVNPCASTTRVNFLATDMTVYNTGDNVDSESNFTNNVRLIC